MRIFAIIFLFLFSHQTLLALDLSRQTSFDLRETCEVKNKAIWREFGNSCGDGCEMQFDKFKICDNSLAVSCDCGEMRCWNGKSCVENSFYKKIYDKKVKDWQAKIEKDKEARAKDFEEQRQRILRKLVSESESRAMSLDIEGAANNYIDAYKENFEEFKRVPIVQDTTKAINNGAQNIQNTVNDNNNTLPPLAPPIVIDSSKAQVPPVYLEQEKLKQNQNNAGNKSLPDANLGAPALPVIPIPK